MLIEAVTFTLAPGVAEADFLAADARLQTAFAYARPGLVRRTTAKADDGGWLVLTFWASAADADASAQAASDDAAASAFTALVDPATVAVARYTSLD